jgi:hypothetical protein
MTQQEILSALCVYDNRNPRFTHERQTKSCDCYNCITKRSDLANHILGIQENTFTKDSWEEADKITHEGYIYVRYNDLKINKQ